MKKKISYFLSLSVAVSMLLAGCNSSNDKKTGGTAEKSQDQVLNLIGNDELPGLDSSTATDAESFNVLGNVMEGLLTLGKDDVVEPGIAEGKPEINADKTVYTFHLRDAKWSNGDAVTAYDFEYAWKRGANPKTASQYASMFTYLKNGEDVISGKNKNLNSLGVKATDAKTLVVTLEKPVPYFESLVTFPTFYPLNQKYVESQGKNYALEAGNLIFDGPFKLSKWDHNVSYTLEKNDNYWDAKDVKLKTINYNIVKDVAATVNLYTTKKVDRVILSSEFVDKFRTNEDFGTYGTPTTFFLRLNEKRNPDLKNVNIRKALTYAINRGDITNGILNNGSKPIGGIVPANFVQANGSDFHQANGDLVSFDKAKATQYWQQGLKELGKKNLTLELLGVDDDTNKKIEEYLQGAFTSALPGLTINIKQVPFKQKLDNETKQDYDISLGGWGPDYLDATTFLNMFESKSEFNQMSFNDGKYDDLMNKANKDYLADIPKRDQALLDAEKILIQDDAAIIPLYQRSRAYLMQHKVHGLIIHNIGPDYTLKNIEIK
ncbi:peptide ABC transporter substrate-binding protein [Bacillus sp. RG28]|uniref:Peptide ABC transporter substrate-binding protein n=1 Tax=Gottfriedia endophytica TaxID=2820819 RepID=A0A940NMF4_9BACI|nr:peptide ABC transporter substrate-binding protein [Gottfriedia endophytica]MBP0724133.1 peptide ABC transporter substrate-binding protein [Gottfriedia endophytica]